MRIKEIKEVALDTLRPFAEEHGMKVKKGDFSVSYKDKTIEKKLDFDYLTWGFEVNLYIWV